jgi:hypothetical protein
LVGLSPTRWGSIYLVVKRIKELWPSFIAVCKEFNIAHLSERHRRLIFELETLLMPFFDFLVHLQGETYVTVSKVYTKVKEVLFHVENSIFTDGTIKQYQNELALELQSRFSRILNTYDERFNASFIVAALLDPQEAQFVDESETKATALLLSVIESSNSSKESTQDITVEPVPSSLSEYKKSILAKAVTSSTSANIRNYLRAVKSLGQAALSIDPIKYWLNSDPSFECLRDYALNIMVVPATTGPLERCFNHAGIATKGTKNQTSAKVLNEKLVVHLNKNLT